MPINLNEGPSGSVSPVGNSFPSAVSISTQGTTSNPNMREYQVVIGLESNLGSAYAPGDYHGQKGGLYIGVEGKAGTGDIWATNPLCTLDPSSGNYSCLVVEVDLNNNNQEMGAAPGSAGLAAPVSYAHAISGVGAYHNTSGYLVAGTGYNWNRGITIGNNCVVQSSFQDLGNAATALDIQGSHTYGLDFANMTGANNYAIRMNNNSILGWRNGANTANLNIIQVDGSNNIIIGTGGAALFTRQTVLPASDNTWSCGGSANGWSNVFAHNFTTLSDPSLKTDIQPLPSMLSVIGDISPVTFKWKTGGYEEVEVEEDQLVHEHIWEEHEVKEVEMRDGKAVLVTVKKRWHVPQYDEHHVTDENGTLLYHHLPAIEPQEAQIDAKGKIIKPAQPGRPETTVPRVHRAPRMVTEKIKVKKLMERPGARTHWGFLAPNVKAAMDKTGFDFGGYVKGENGIQHLRPDQLIPVLVKAVQELSEQVTKLTSTTTERTAI